MAGLIYGRVFTREIHEFMTEYRAKFIQNLARSYTDHGDNNFEEYTINLLSKLKEIDRILNRVFEPSTRNYSIAEDICCLLGFKNFNLTSDSDSNNIYLGVQVDVERKGQTFIVTEPTDEQKEVAVDYLAKIGFEPYLFVEHE